ncbi:hypothetical protein O7606_12670 [Micromonospora sp. WMMD882]|uniref:hypothetical protein n=1 Tax=Micromonospora sp. WMMD882 TaxID=3015151 RepID=UPI00248B7F36|nr:hypothetical protein [Micromonospora sp. WMMD882]WBB82139.1 hypothetical protein O7606_12670 [Micromonospora sp. WMMD882]
MAYRPGPNSLLRVTRLALRSPSGSGRPKSWQELADAVNVHTHTHTGCRSVIDARYIDKLERAEHRWLFEPYRTALRKVLDRATNADLGFFVVKGHAQDPEVSPEEPGPGGWTSVAPGADAGRPVSVGTEDGPVITARAAAVRVTVSAHAVTVAALVRHDDTTGAVVVLAGPVEVLITPSDIARDRLAAVPVVPSTGADLRQVYRLPDRWAR